MVPFVFGLSETQEKVLLGMALGDSVAESAERFGIHPRAVKFHRAEVFKKLQVPNQQKVQGLLIRRLLHFMETIA